jgi:phosphohistidine phosphatase
LSAAGRRQVGRFGAGDHPGILARALAAGCPAPKLIVASDASRARQTADAAAAAFGLGPARLEPWLYRASAEEVMAWLWTLPDQLGAVMVVGHNPTMHVLVADLVTTSAPDRFAPGTVAVVHFGVDRWAALSPGAGRLLYCATA